MNKRTLILGLTCAGILLAQAGQKPNVVFILIDDMGYKDVGCYGAEVYETPHIDSLRADGMKFTRAYVPVAICSPTRASALTGKHSTKLLMWNHTDHIPKDEKIMPAFLKEAGYQTWHVGCKEDQTYPEQMGFDVNVGGNESWGPGSYFWPYGSAADGSRGFKKKPSKKGKPRPYHPNSWVPGLYSGGKEGEYLTDRLTDEALTLLDNRDPGQPFLLNLWHYGVHNTKEAKRELIKKYKAKIKAMGLEPAYWEDPVLHKKLLLTETNPVYAAMLESIDDSVGRVIQKLKEIGEYENTLIIFMSDNGPTTIDVPCTPFRGGKNTNYEGGVRVPAIMAWPGRIPANSRYDRVIRTEDVFDTVMEAAGVPADSLPEGDGQSLIPVFRGESLDFRSPWHFFPRDQHVYGGRGGSAIYDEASGMKYIVFFNGDPAELYNLNEDEGERNNLIAAHPEMAAQLRKELVSRIKRYYPRMVPHEPYHAQIMNFINE
jgi:arylsulfatase A-like enzyme